jgi:hypothetical protein
VQQGALISQYQIFPLQRHLEEAKEQGWIEKIILPAILLSSIPDVPRELVEQLELAGIYDSDDLADVQEDMSQYLGLPPAEFEDIRSLVTKESVIRSEIPRITLPLPENYALASVASDTDFNALAIIWNQILFAWQNPKKDGWGMTKLAFDRFYVKQGCPELIGSLGSATPVWLHEISDISTFLSNLIPGESISDKVETLGYPSIDPVFSALDKSIVKVLELAYLIHVAKQSTIKNRQPI